VTTTQIEARALDWLLAPEDPAARAVTLRDLLDAPADDPELLAAQKEALHEGPIAVTLDHMESEGYWSKEGPGFRPTYYSSVWSIIVLGQCGANPRLDERIPRATAYLVDHALASGGQFSMNGAPGGTIDCHQGNMLRALSDLGNDDPRLDAAWEWMARTVTGEGIAPLTEKKAPLRYYSGKCGRLFACGANNGQPCAWGAAEVMSAFARLPEQRRTPLVQRAIDAGVSFLLDCDTVNVPWPNGMSDHPSSKWWKFGFPVFYVCDLLRVAECLSELGYANDPRLALTLDLIRSKQDEQGRWNLENNYPSKTWANFGSLNKPNKWVTIRALRVLRRADM
jgi:hypothetical protein